ncbi:MAG: DUF4250 domain-containing protein [Blautia sp.]|nr:DUF4250 domain-containing protein [Blautia sp.]
MTLPKDPFMLLSYINTQLRDNYSTFKDLASSLGISEEEILQPLAKAGYHYDDRLNRFVQ